MNVLATKLEVIDRRDSKQNLYLRTAISRNLPKTGHLPVRRHGLGRFRRPSLALIAASILLLSVSHLLSI
jgi:hypothetical protein